jgi:hypothetical protein
VAKNIIREYFDYSTTDQPSARFHNIEYFVYYHEAAHVIASPANPRNTLNDVGAQIYVNEYLANSFARC